SAAVSRNDQSVALPALNKGSPQVFVLMAELVRGIPQSSGSEITVQLDFDRPAFAVQCITDETRCIGRRRRQPACAAEDRRAGIRDQRVEICGPYEPRLVSVKQR